jgi:hypothetical protein
LLILLAIGADWFITSNLKKSNKGEVKVWNDIYQSKIDADLVIYGSSRGWQHFSCKIIEDSLKIKAYNLGGNAFNFYLEYLRHSEYIKNNAAPKIIIISLDFSTFYKKNKITKAQFQPYIFTNTVMQKGLEQFAVFVPLDFVIPVLRYRGRTDEIKGAVNIALNIDNKPDRYKGSKMSATEKNKKYNSDLPPTDYDNFDTAQIALFNQFIQECKSKKINVIMVYSPEYSADRPQLMNAQAKAKKFYNLLSHKYHIPFHDYSTDPVFCKEVLFRDPLHLNFYGATYFTQMFVQDLKKDLEYKNS